MSDLTSDRSVAPLLDGRLGNASGPAANAQYYFGQLVMKGHDDGLIKPVSSSAGINAVCVGVSQFSGLVSATAPSPYGFLPYQFGTFNFKNDGTITANTLPGTLVYASDNQTVTTTKGSNSVVAGRFVELDSSQTYGTWITVSPATSVSGSTF